MKLYIIATTLLFATATVSGKKYIVSYPNDTKQPVVDENAQVLEQKGCEILHKYTLIKAISVDCPVSAMKSFEVWAQGQGQHPTIEEDQIVSTQD